MDQAELLVARLQVYPGVRPQEAAPDYALYEGREADGMHGPRGGRNASLAACEAPQHLKLAIQKRLASGHLADQCPTGLDIRHRVPRGATPQHDAMVKDPLDPGLRKELCAHHALVGPMQKCGKRHLTRLLQAGAIAALAIKVEDASQFRPACLQHFKDPALPHREARKTTQVNVLPHCEPNSVLASRVARAALGASKFADHGACACRRVGRHVAHDCLSGVELGRQQVPEECGHPLLEFEMGNLRVHGGRQSDHRLQQQGCRQRHRGYTLAAWQRCAVDQRKGQDCVNDGLLDVLGSQDALEHLARVISLAQAVVIHGIPQVQLDLECAQETKLLETGQERVQ